MVVSAGGLEAGKNIEAAIVINKEQEKKVEQLFKELSPFWQKEFKIQLEIYASGGLEPEDKIKNELENCVGLLTKNVAKAVLKIFAKPEKK